MSVKHFASLLFICSFFAYKCDRRSSKPSKGDKKEGQNTPSFKEGKRAPQSKVTQMTFEELTKKYGWNLPANQAKGDELPPQPGQKFQGVTIKHGPGEDTKCTASVLVLLAETNGKDKIEKILVLTQKRAIPPKGKLEGPGGHLPKKKTWCEGVLEELSQETGIEADPAKILFLRGGKLELKNGYLFGHMNFVTVFKDNKPSTTVQCPEIDKNYGHVWLDLRTVYDEVVEENNKIGIRKDGKYFRFFRTDVINFCREVLKW